MAQVAFLYSDNSIFDLHKYDENKLEFELFGKNTSGKYALVRTQVKTG